MAGEQWGAVASSGEQWGERLRAKGFRWLERRFRAKGVRRWMNCLPRVIVWLTTVRMEFRDPLRGENAPYILPFHRQFQIANSGKRQPKMKPRAFSSTKISVPWKKAPTKTPSSTTRTRRTYSSESRSSGGGDAEQQLLCVDPCKQLCKILLSCSNAGLEPALDASGLRASPAVAEEVLLRFENAGMVAYRFFDWARRQHRGFAHTQRACNTVVAALAKIRQYKLMWDLVAAMRADGALCVETFCIIMRKYARAQKVDEALYTFDVMDKHGVPPNSAALAGLLSALCKSKNVRKAQEVFDKMRDRFEADAKTYSILLEGWGRAPNLPKMREVYREMIDRGCEPDIVTYGIIVDALCKAGRMEEAVDVVRDMGRRGCPPTSFIYSVLVHTYGVEKRIEDAVDTFLEMERNGVKPDVVVYNALVGAFCKANKFENAFRVVGDMEDKGIAPVARTFNIILNGLITAQRNEEAYRVFRRMIKGCEPDSDTYTMMIKMFFENDRLEMALKVWKYMGKKQFLPSMHTFSVLINGLCEKGEVNRACVMLENMIEKGIRPPGTTFGKLRQLLLKEGREDVLKFLVEKMNDLIQEPLCD